MTDNGASTATWDLEPLVNGKGVAGVDEMLTDASDRADTLAEREGRDRGSSLPTTSPTSWTSWRR